LGLLRCCLGYFKWGLIATVLAGLALWLYIGRHVDEELRRQVEAYLAGQLPHLKVSVDAARRVEGEGIHLKGVRLSDPAASGPAAELVTIDEVLLACDTALKSLVRGDVQVQHFLLRRPCLHVTRRVDGVWNVLRLWQGPHAGNLSHALEGQIEGGSIEVVDATQSPPSRCTLRDIQLKWTPGPAGNGDVLRVVGQLQGDHLRQVEFQGEYVPGEDRLALAGKIQDLDISPALFAALPSEAARLRALTWLQARAEVTFRLAYEPRQPAAWQFQTTAQLQGGRIEHPGLPYPLRELQGTVQASNQGLLLQNIVARNGQTTLGLSARRDGWQAAAPATVQLAGRQIAFDRRLWEALPPDWRATWREYSPEGEADIDATLVFDGRGWNPSITLSARNMTFVYESFPYPLRQTAGAITYLGNQLKFDVTGLGGGANVRVRGELASPGPAATGWITADGQNVPIDRELIAALDTATRQVVLSLQPRGLVDVHAEYVRRPGERDWQTTIKVGLHDGFLRYQGFPYSLANVTGFIEQHNENWTFRQVRGNNGSGRVECEGTLRPAGNELELVLNITGRETPLNDELRAAVGPKTKMVWDQLRPQGAVNLGVAVRYLTVQDRMSLAVDVTPVENAVTLEPRAFPYRFERVQGRAKYQDGYVELKGLQAVHGDVRWQAGGISRAAPDGSWTLRLSDLAVERLRVDRDLLQASPEGLREALRGLNPKGPLNLSGHVSFFLGPRQGDALRTAWDVNVFCHGNQVQAGVPLDDVFGSVQLAGEHHIGHVRCDGKLRLDSLTVNGYQFTDVAGPIQILGDRVLLGTPTARQLEPGPDHITAKCYGGLLYGDAWVTRASPANFSLRAKVKDADLGRFSREAVVGRQAFSGRADGEIVLNGNSLGAHTLQGQGNIALRDANIYELPVMLSLLKMLSLKSPDLTAFTTSNIEFSIGDRYAYFKRIDLNGDALSLYGRGYVSFDKQLGLRFRPEVGRGSFHVPIISDLIKGASGQILELYIGGTLENPDVRREPFPGLKEAIENLQPPALLQPTGQQPNTSRPNWLVPRR
jgi:hypothetical protein